MSRPRTGRGKRTTSASLDPSNLTFDGQYILDEHNEPVLAGTSCSGPSGSNATSDGWYVATEITISTLFLGIDHSHGYGAPVLWER